MTDILQPHETWNIIDASKLSTYMECPRKYFYEYILGWRSTTPRQDLVFGEAVHAGLEILYSKGFDQLELACLVLEDTYRKSFDPMTDDTYGAKTVANAQEALAEYIEYYRTDPREYTVLHTEVSGKTSIQEGMDLYFRLDCVMEDKKTGQKFVLEHKTTGRGGGQWLAQWPLSLQVGAYTHALYGLYPSEEVYGVRVNGLIFLKKGTNFMRCSCAKTQAQMDVWYNTAKNWYRQLRFDQEVLLEKQDEFLSRTTMNLFSLNTGSCTRWGVCAYHDFCCTWANPLHRVEEGPPIGFAVDHWDCRKHYAERHEAKVEERKTLPEGLF